MARTAIQLHDAKADVWASVEKLPREKYYREPLYRVEVKTHTSTSKVTISRTLLKQTMKAGARIVGRA